ADIDISDDEGRTPLHAAVERGHKECVRALLTELLNRFQLSAPASVEFSNLAAESSPAHACPEFGAIINRADTSGRTALMLAAEVGSSELVMLLLMHGAQPGLTDQQGRTALYYGAVGGAEESVDALLCFADCQPLAADTTGRTALHVAAAAGHVGVMGSLLQAVGRGKVDSLLDRQHRSPLHYACHNSHEACVELLLQYTDSKTLVGAPFSPFHAAAYQGNEHCLSALLTHFGSAPLAGADGRGRTPLHVAAERGRRDCVPLLVTCREPLTAGDRQGRTPLQTAARHGHLSTVECLLDAGSPAGHRDRGGRTALHLACEAEHSRVAVRLVERVGRPALLNITDKAGQTALHVAARRGLVDVTDALVSHGASVSCVDARGYTPALATTVSDAHADCLSLILAGDRADRMATSVRLSSGSSQRLSETGSAMKRLSLAAHLESSLEEQTYQSSDSEFY
ncbi:serine/threonine-protein phosphatase 6 regulatory ankyrin repeat subunit A-like, partial [Amphibalanus amphitrite]|uniref:serine/threonine-protein phosphatase 6 regulatory ankyrin repeat subunit A-like n=1 Tax=Amphibalanus amphitrite TaxID=1232801 RepID=UPI001C90E991